MLHVKHAKKLFVVLVVWIAGLSGMVGGTDRAAARVEPGLESSVLRTLSAMGLAYEWHTFYSSATETTELRSIAVDTSGNVYAAGHAHGTWGTPLHAYSGDNDLVVIKLNSLGAYQWHTFYGAAPTASEDGDDEASGIAVDSSGNVYITGYSDRTWQGPGSASPLHLHGGNSEYMFVLKLNGSGAYQWHTPIAAAATRTSS